MARKRINIRNQLYLARPGRGTTHPPRERDDKAAVTPLIGADLEQLRLGHAVKPGPIKPRVAMMDLTGNRCHERNLIRLALGQRLNGFAQVVVIYAHVIVLDTATVRFT